MLTNNGTSRVALVEDWFARAFEDLSSPDYYAFVMEARSPHGVYTRAVAKASADLSAAKQVAKDRCTARLAELRAECGVDTATTTADRSKAFDTFTQIAGLPLLERTFEIEAATQLYREAVLPHKMEYSAALEALYLKYSPKEGTNRRDRGTTGEPDMVPDEEEPVADEPVEEGPVDPMPEDDVSPLDGGGENDEGGEEDEEDEEDE